MASNISGHILKIKKGSAAGIYRGFKSSGIFSIDKVAQKQVDYQWQQNY